MLLALQRWRPLARVPLSYRVAAAGIALVVVLTADAVIALQSAQRVFDQQERLRSGLVALYRTEAVMSAVKDIETSLRGFFITGDPHFLEPYEQARRALPEQRRQLDAELGGDAVAGPLLADLDHKIETFLDQSQTFALMRDQMRDAISLESLRPLLERQKERMDEMRDSAAALALNQAMANASLTASMQRVRRSARISILVPSLISVLMAAFLCYLVIRDLRQRQGLEGRSERLLEQERRARTDAEAANQAKDEFVSTVSHELRTPLQAILGWSQFLLRSIEGRETAPAAQLGGQIRTIERNARSLARMIDDLLDVSRAISGKLSLSTRKVDLADVVQSSVEVARPAAAGKGVQLLLEVRDAPLWMAADAERLRQVTSNLISNAVKFTPPGGRVTVSAARVDGKLELCVLDTGVGIAPELLPRIFERYVQGSVSSARRYGGLGLGLAIVKHLVEMHGGQVAVRSDGVGLGALFLVTFPVQAVVEAQPPEQPASTASAPLPAERDAGAAVAAGQRRLDGLRLLVVDDDPDVRSVLQSLLRAEGARVVTAASAGEAMERLRFQRMDVVLSDIAMPETDGYTLARQIRALREREGATPASVPLIAFTAFSRQEDARRALDSGFDRHIAKPADIEKLVALLNVCVQPGGYLPIELQGTADSGG
ncbi:MAG: response regulator [Nevskia sp.]|nr:response regulator [Nevskia sp.]